MFCGYLKQSTAVTIKVGPLTNNPGEDPITVDPFLASAIRISKNGGALAVRSDTSDGALDAVGIYDVALNATDTNGLGILTVVAFTAGLHPHRQTYQVLPANVWDSLMAGSDTLDVQVTGIGANVVTATSIASNAVTAAKIASDAITAAKIAADVTTEIAAGITIPTAAAIADAVWDEARSGHTTAGSFGQGVASVQGNVTGSVGSVTGSVGSVAAAGITAASFDAGAISEPAVASNTITAAKIATNAITSAKIDATFGNEIADAVWDEQRSGHVAAGSFGEGVSVASMLSSVGNMIADHVLRRPYGSARTSSDGDAVSFRSLLGGLGKLVNKWSISGTTLTVYQEDDTTSSAPGGTQTLTAAPGADPISAIDT